MTGLRIQLFERRKQPGFTLVELSAVVAISSVLLGVAVSVILMLEKQEDRIGLKSQQALDLSRLSDQFRKDVHQAKSVDSGIGEGPESLRVVCLSLAGEQIEYHLKENQFIRQVTGESGEQRSERFLVPQHTTAGLSHLVLGDSDSKGTTAKSQTKFVQLHMAWSLAGDEKKKDRLLSIVAQIGKTLPVHLKAKGDDRASAE